MIKSVFKYNIDVYLFTRKRLIEHIVQKLLKPIRYHRDQRGDDRCWFDDLWLYWYLPESKRKPVQLSQTTMAEYCAHYHDCRGSNSAPSTVIDEGQDDNCYLLAMSLAQLRREACRLREGIRKHRDLGMMSRKLEHDQALYALLPDDVEADFRLPPRNLFLPNCARICGMQDVNNVDLSQWPAGQVSPLADWRP